MSTRSDAGTPEEGHDDIQQLCQYLSDRSPQPMLAVRGKTHVVSYVNPAFAGLVGKERQELVGRPFAEAVPEGEENGCIPLLDRVFRTGMPEILAEQEHRHTQPQPVYWSYSVWAILGADEVPEGVMIQVTDATETAVYRRQAKTMNEALLVSSMRQHELATAAELLSERLRAAVQSRDQFLAVLSHELRNPLAALSYGLQLLKPPTIDPMIAENCWAMVDRQSKQMARLVDDLLDVSRIATGKLILRKERVELAAVVRNAVEASRGLIVRQGHELTVAQSSVPVVLTADPIRLAQVFLNLLNNAAKYSERGGHIWLSVERDGSEVVVSVRDNGIGIPASRLPQVFDVFVQVDTDWRHAQGGLGIGLSLVKELVSLHGGRVEARSDGLGKGCEFIVRLPVTDAPTLDEAPMGVPALPRGPRRRILVVDDNRDAADSLAMMLEILGHEVRTAYDGATGVTTAQQYRPQMILMDIGMPKLDGYAAAQRIRTESWGSEAYLVALTGWGSENDRRRTQEAGFNQHLVKPVDLDALVKVINEVRVGL